MYVRDVRPSQQYSCETVPPKSTLSGLINGFMGLLVTHGTTFNYVDLFGVA